VDFTWDARKDRLNRQEHRISFDTALHVFDDPYHVTTQDREVDGESRWQTIGMVGRTTCHSLRTLQTTKAAPTTITTP
jgi:uncharacterized DUF497 family protein